jgi:hypothetical protein
MLGIVRTGFGNEEARHEEIAPTDITYGVVLHTLFGYIGGGR